MRNESAKADSEHHDRQSEPVSLDAVGSSIADDTDVAGERATEVKVPDAGASDDIAADESFASRVTDASSEPQPAPDTVAENQRPAGKEVSLAAAAGSRSVNSGQTAGDRSSRRRRSLNSMARKLEHATRRLRHQRIAMVVLIGIAALILLVTVGISTSAGNQERDMEFRLNRKDIEIAKLRATVEQQQASIKGFVNQRLPGLIDMEFDRVFEVDHPYVRTIAFTNVRTKQNNGYEFRIVLENQTAPIAAPAIDIILFGALGLEIDRRKLRVDRGVNTIEIEILSRGDVRSYVDSFSVQEDAAPAYFLVR